MRIGSLRPGPQKLDAGAGGTTCSGAHSKPPWPRKSSLLSPRRHGNAHMAQCTWRSMDYSLDSEGYQSKIVRSSRIKYNDPAALPLRRRALWQPEVPGIGRVLIVKKVKNEEATKKAAEIGAWLQKRGIQVLVERQVYRCELPQFSPLDHDVSLSSVDFCITLGGDGTVLHFASLFERDEPMPPVLSFAMGTLGFLTPFDAASYEHVLRDVMEAQAKPLNCTLRTRKLCGIVQDGTTLAVRTVLNEVVIDRGAYPGSVILEVFVDGSYITTVEADGLIIATPSGSTAYSMSAGGSLIAPSVPCTIITPIAPLSLSSRPIVIPESSSIVVQLPEYARSDARASFDGKKAMRIKRGTCVDIHTARFPLPVISMGMLDADWYEGIVAKLHWNQVIKARPQLPKFKSIEIDPEWKNSMEASMDGGLEIEQLDEDSLCNVVLDNNEGEWEMLDGKMGEGMDEVNIASGATGPDWKSEG